MVLYLLFGCPVTLRVLGKSFKGWNKDITSLLTIRIYFVWQGKEVSLSAFDSDKGNL